MTQSFEFGANESVMSSLLAGIGYFAASYSGSAAFTLFGTLAGGFLGAVSADSVMKGLGMDLEGPAPT